MCEVAGGVLKKHFSNVGVGIIGVFGSHYLSRCVSHPGDAEVDSKNYFQWINGTLTHFINDKYFDSNGEVDVVAVDGIWFAMQKALTNKISFDENFSGFHFYDMDICMQSWQANYKVMAINDILIEHINQPNINRTFINATYQFYKKWKFMSPMLKGIELSDKELNIIDRLCQYKNYSRDLQCQLDEIKKTKWYKIGNKIKHIKQHIKQWLKKRK